MKVIDGKNVYSVSEINAQTRLVLEGMSFWVEGEISSFRGLNNHYRYLYFDLKDPQTAYKLPCILEPEIYTALGFDMIDGQKVLALGNLTLWEKEAKFQMYVHKIEEFGQGYLFYELEKLKKRLDALGYFRQDRKKPLPMYATNIAVITSKVSDAWQDFKRHSIDVFGIIRVTLFDVMVQGKNSAPGIIAAIKLADKRGFDAVVIIRGGGSLEDLASYNDERLAQAIYEAKTPIVTGVGHEKDVTIAQLVADIAASTPTDAAKIITADFVSLEEKLADVKRRLKAAVTSSLWSNSQTLDLAFHKLVRHKERFYEFPKHLEFLRKSLLIFETAVIGENQKRLAILLTSLKNAAKFSFNQKRQTLGAIWGKLEILSPQKTLLRGYSIVTDLNNKLIKSAAAVGINSTLRVQFAQGKVVSKVIKKELK